MNKETKKEFESLARMIKKGFDSVGVRLANLEIGQENIKARLTNLEVGQEDIKLRLDNVAYRFEVKELEKRVDVLEKKLGIAGAK